MKVDKVWCSSILYTGLDMCSSHCKKKNTGQSSRLYESVNSRDWNQRKPSGALSLKGSQNSSTGLFDAIKIG